MVGSRQCGMLHIRCNYMLLIDNLMDLTHIPFVHGNTIGGKAQIDLIDAEVETRRTERGVQFIRWTMGHTPPPLFVKVLELEPGVKIDRWQEFEFVAPASVDSVLRRRQDRPQRAAKPRAAGGPFLASLSRRHAGNGEFLLLFLDAGQFHSRRSAVDRGDPQGDCRRPRPGRRDLGGPERPFEDRPRPHAGGRQERQFAHLRPARRGTLDRRRGNRLAETRAQPDDSGLAAEPEDRLDAAFRASGRADRRRGRRRRDRARRGRGVARQRTSRRRSRPAAVAGKSSAAGRCPRASHGCDRSAVGAVGDDDAGRSLRRVDALVFVVGFTITPPARLDEISLGQWDDVITGNLRSAFVVARRRCRCCTRRKIRRSSTSHRGSRSIRSPGFGATRRQKRV